MRAIEGLEDFEVVQLCPGSRFLKSAGVTPTRLSPTGALGARSACGSGAATGAACGLAGAGAGCSGTSGGAAASASLVGESGTPAAG